ncbi:MAG: glycosyltransferase family 4 protein [Chlorobiaceae bacterium]|nr:glycosyltransferase family 4 protein [Chlorobiaceae bacterium]
MSEGCKVLIAIPCLGRGGTEIQTLYLVRVLVRSGYKVCVLCYFEHDDSVVDEYRTVGCTVQLMGMARSMGPAAVVGALRKAISAFSPDVVHVQYMTPGALSILAARLAGVKTVVATVHQPYSAWHSPVWKILLRMSALLCNHFISVSLNAEISWFGNGVCIDDCAAHHLPRHFTIHNAVDVALVENLMQTACAGDLTGKNADAKGFVFGYIGRLSHEKGVDVLVDAFGILAGRYCNIRLLVVGGGPERAILDARYSSCDWWKRVLFAGTQSWENAMRHLTAMDAVVVPSRFEGFGLSAVEAMAGSRPVIVSAAGGLSEIVENNRSGLIFENESVADLVTRMELILLQPAFKYGLSVEAKRRAKEFDVDHFNRRISRFYREIL